MSNHFVQKVASVVLILGIFVSIFMAAQTARANNITFAESNNSPVLVKGVF
ncbi:MAG TPA: hypothetical protein PKD79_00745 [Candidatus Doudnabacteria bacterium]|nr:hypothetical protein [Candidatus Doudnabacteria bacterium]